MAVYELGSAWVTPDWLPLAIVVALLFVIALLYWSMRRNIARIDIPEEGESPATPTDRSEPGA